MKLKLLFKNNKNSPEAYFIKIRTNSNNCKISLTVFSVSDNKVESCLCKTVTVNCTFYFLNVIKSSKLIRF